MKNILIFVSGAAIGSVITWKLIEKKYKDLADEEIESVIETFKNRKNTPRNKEEIVEMVNNVLDKPLKNDIKEISINEQYISSDQEESEDDKNSFIDVETGIEVVPPYVIQPEQFGEYEDYGTKSLTLYSDGVLVDEINEPITEDLDVMLGADSLNHFGEYEDDSVYVRDDTNEIDYEILKSEKQFSEITIGVAN